MEINTSLQNGQESKVIYNTDDSPMRNSTGREEEFYSCKSNPFKNSSSQGSSSQNHVCHTENKEESSVVVECGSISCRHADGASSTFQNNCPDRQNCHSERKSDSQKTEVKAMNETYSKFQTPPAEIVDTPMKRSSNFNDTRNISSIGFEISEDEQKKTISSLRNGTLNNSKNDQYLRTQDIQLFPQLNSANMNKSSKASVDLNSKRCMVAESSEESKSKKPFDTEFDEDVEEYKGQNSLNKQLSNTSKEAKSDNVLNYVFDIEEFLGSNNQRICNNGINDDEEDDAEIGKIENQRKMQRVVERNLLELNEYQGNNSINQESSENKSTIRNSFPSYVHCDLETKEGWLLKRSFSYPSVYGWQKKYCVVRGQKFMYYKSESKDMLDGVIDFNLLTCMITVPNSTSSSNVSGLSFKIDVLASNRNFEFTICESKDVDVMEWLRVIHKHHVTSRGYKTDYTRVAIQKNFWKSLRISEEDYIKNAKTGDVLLFRGKSFFSKFQRLFTRGEYDHVAMLFKFGDRLVLFESTGELGVDLLDWTGFMNNKWHNLYTKLVFRKLHYEFNEDELEALEVFAQKVKGKKYKVNPVKICRKKSTRDATDNIKETKSYFCSELVASAFKRIGLLPENISATQYWPSDFSTRSSLDLQKGAWLGDEYLIDFSL